MLLWSKAAPTIRLQWLWVPLTRHLSNEMSVELLQGRKKKDIILVKPSRNSAKSSHGLQLAWTWMTWQFINSQPWSSLLLHSITDIDRLEKTQYSALLSADNTRYTATQSLCLTYCSINITCLSGSYNSATSICYTSSKAEFINTNAVLPENTVLPPLVFVKKSAALNKVVYELRDGIAVGECNHGDT